MKITLCCIILPRLEVPFLEEWIRYHLDLGISEIHIYNNGHVSVDPTNFCNDIAREDGKNDTYIWSKKRNAKYIEDKSDAEVDEMLNAIIDKFDSVHLHSWIHGIDHEIEYPKSQQHSYSHCMRTTNSEWYINIDPDEFLVIPNMEIQDYLAKLVKHGYGYVEFGQRLFDERIDFNKPVLSIAKYAADVTNITKYLVYKGTRERYPNIHNATPLRGKAWKAPLSEIRFNHYRGNPNKWNISPRWKIHSECKFDKIDQSIVPKENV